MARPTPLSVTQSGNNAAATAQVVSYPAFDSGELVVLNIATDGGVNTHTLPGSGPNGETIVSVVNSHVNGSGGGPTSSVFYFIGSATTAAGTLTVTNSASESWVAVSEKFADGDFDSANPIVTSAVNASPTNVSTVPSPAFTAAAADAGGLLQVWIGVDADPISAAPTGWTAENNTDIGNVAGQLASRDAAVTASESIASANWTIASDTYANIAYIVREASGATSVTGTAAQSLSVSATQSASGTVTPVNTVAGVAAQAVAIALVQAASGTVTPPLAVDGVAAQSQSITVAQSASGTVTPPLQVTGTAAQSVQVATTQAASGTVTPPLSVPGSAAQTQAVTIAQSAAGAVQYYIEDAGGTVEQFVFIVPSQAATGSVTAPGSIAGAAAQTQAVAITQAGTGTVTPVQSVSGTAAQSQQVSIAQSASGAVSAAGTITGAAAQSIDVALVQAASGSVTAPTVVTGSAAQSVQVGIAQAGTGLVNPVGSIVGSGAQQISVATVQSASGTITAGVPSVPVALDVLYSAVELDVVLVASGLNTTV